MPDRPASGRPPTSQARAARPPQVAVVLPYWDFFAGATSVDLRQDRVRLLEAAAETVRASGSTVIHSQLLEAGSEPVDPRAVPDDADVVLVVSSMACPPAPTLELLRSLPHLGVVVWPCAWPTDGLQDPSHADIVERGATVGAPMITSVLARAGRSVATVPLAVEPGVADPRLQHELRAAATASRLRRARVARVGDPLPGYASVDVDDGTLTRATGCTVVRLSAAELRRRVVSVPPAAARQCADTLAATASIDCPVDVLVRGARAVVALEALEHEHRLDAGTLNCHCDDLRLSPDVGIAPCLALGAVTSRGRPWTCTGDVLTTVAMLVCSELTGTSLYHEIEAYDPARGDFVIANSGEHDSRWSSEDARITESPWWPGSPTLVHPVPTGNATLVAFCVTATGARLIAAEGAVTLDSEPATGTTSCRFAWSGTRAAEGWDRWVTSGAGHHSAMGRGHVADEVASVARHLGIEFAQA